MGDVVTVSVSQNVDSVTVNATPSVSTVDISATTSTPDIEITATQSVENVSVSGSSSVDSVVISLNEPDLSYVTSTTYDGGGRIISVTRSNGLVKTVAYGPGDRVERITSTMGNVTVDVVASYNNDGNLIGFTPV